METPEQIKTRLFRESQSMVSFIAARGVDKELPKDQALKLLDIPIEDRSAVPMHDILMLHQTLARIVSPAFPETIDKLHEHSLRQGWWTGLAPLTSIMWLIGVTVALILALALGLSVPSGLPAGYETALQKVEVYSVEDPESEVDPTTTTVPTADPTDAEVADQAPPTSEATPYFLPVLEYLHGTCRFGPEEFAAVNKDLESNTQRDTFDRVVLAHDQDCQDQRRLIMLRIFAFFGLLGMLGAAYSSIYDSFSYIREGRYDLRLASTYYVRILLGGFSGILLAEPLSDFLEQGAVSSILLAFLGGFSAQLVYDMLTKLVDSLANMFRADRRKERQGILAQAEFNARGIILEDDAAKRKVLAQMLAEAQQEPSAERRAARMQDAVLNMLSGRAEPPGGDAPGAEEATSALERDLHTALRISELSALIADHLPDAPANAADVAETSRTQVAAALAGLHDAQSPTTEVSVKSALAASAQSDLVTDLLASGIAQLRSTLSGRALSAASKGALAAGLLLTPPQIARMRHVAYSATEPDIGLLTGVSLEQLGQGLATLNGATLSAEDILAGLASGDTDAFFADVSDHFADRASFDTALSGWIDTTVRRVLAEDLDEVLLPLADNGLTGEALVEMLDDVARDETARGGLQNLELIGSGVPACETPQAVLAHLIDLADAALSEEDAQ